MDENFPDQPGPTDASSIDGGLLNTWQSRGPSTGDCPSNSQPMKERWAGRTAISENGPDGTTLASSAAATAPSAERAPAFVLERERIGRRSMALTYLVAAVIFLVMLLTLRSWPDGPIDGDGSTVTSSKPATSVPVIRCPPAPCQRSHDKGQGVGG